MIQLAQLIDRHGVQVDDHLDRDDLIPVLEGLQFQGDVAVIPAPPAPDARPSGAVFAPVQKAGIPVVRGENGGNTHLLLADGEARFAPVTGGGTSGLTLGLLDIPEGATAWLAHPEHGYVGVAPGLYEVRRQREQADVVRMVAD
jgi:hypothetical protein